MRGLGSGRASPRPVGPPRQAGGAATASGLQWYQGFACATARPRPNLPPPWAEEAGYRCIALERAGMRAKRAGKNVHAPKHNRRIVCADFVLSCRFAFEIVYLSAQAALLFKRNSKRKNQLVGAQVAAAHDLAVVQAEGVQDAQAVFVASTPKSLKCAVTRMLCRSLVGRKRTACARAALRGGWASGQS